MSKYRDFVDKTLGAAMQVMSLQDWRLHVKFDCEHHDAPEGWMANTVTSVDYLEATITLSPACKQWFKEGNLGELTKVLCHELCHIWTAPLVLMAQNGLAPVETEYLTRENERLTERIARVVARLV